MIHQAKVASIEALENFRATLVVYLSKARPTLEDMCDDVRQTRMWLESDRISHWENAVRMRTRDLNQAQQELFSSKLSNLKVPTTTQQHAVAHAKHALTEAEDKLRLVRKWCRDYDNMTQPLAKQIEQAHSFLAIDMHHAVDFLTQMVDKLEAYADLNRSGLSASPIPSNEQSASAAPADSGKLGEGTSASSDGGHEKGAAYEP